MACPKSIRRKLIERIVKNSKTKLIRSKSKLKKNSIINTR
jgi:hypothetical protein